MILKFDMINLDLITIDDNDDKGEDEWPTTIVFTVGGTESPALKTLMSCPIRPLL